MSTAWVAGSVRARAMSRRRLGKATARALAGHATLETAVDALAATSYGRDVHVGMSMDQAQHAVASTLLWHLRVLAGWVPHGDARILRVLAGGFEIANVDERLHELAGGPVDPPFHLGTLETTWSTLAPATSVAALRETLARSAWGEPGADTPVAIRLGMRLSWAARVASTVDVARDWACGAAVILTAREVFLEQRTRTASATRLATSLLGSRWPDAGSVRMFAEGLPPAARWALADVDEPGDLWRAEGRWWARVDHDGHRLLRRPLTTPAPVIGSVAVLAADAWRVRAALEVAARGGGAASRAMEAFDVVA